MTAHSLWPDTAKMMGAAPGVSVDDDGCRGSGQAARRSAAGFCAGRRPLNREQCMRRTGCLRSDKPPPEDRCDQRFGLAGLFAAYLSPYTPVLRSEPDCDRAPGHGLDAFERCVTRSVVADQVGQEVRAPAGMAIFSGARQSACNGVTGHQKARRRSCRVAHASFQSVTA